MVPDDVYIWCNYCTLLARYVDIYQVSYHSTILLDRLATRRNTRLLV